MHGGKCGSTGSSVQLYNIRLTSLSSDESFVSGKGTVV